MRFYNDNFDYPNCSNNHRNIEMEYFDRSPLKDLAKIEKYIVCSNDIDRFKNHFVGDNFIYNDVDIVSEKAFFDLCLIPQNAKILSYLTALLVGGVHGWVMVK